jgi:hypothetical protein
MFSEGFAGHPVGYSRLLQIEMTFGALFLKFELAWLGVAAQGRL